VSSLWLGANEYPTL